MTRYRFKGQKTGFRNVDLTERFLIGFENINCSFGSEKLPSITGGGSVFLQLLASKQEGRGKTTEVVSIWRSRMNNEETQVTTKLRCYPAYERIVEDRRLE